MYCNINGKWCTHEAVKVCTNGYVCNMWRGFHVLFQEGSCLVFCKKRMFCNRKTQGLFSFQQAVQNLSVLTLGLLPAVYNTIATGLMTLYLPLQNHKSIHLRSGVLTGLLPVPSATTLCGGSPSKESSAQVSFCNLMLHVAYGGFM